MVGMLGCGCCGPNQLCSDVRLKSEIIEDFSPTFDSYFINPPWGYLTNLKIVNEACQCTGPEYSFNARSTAGVELSTFQKATLENPIELLIKLVKWDDDVYQGGNVVFLNETRVKIVCNITTYNAVIINGPYSAEARAYFYNSTGYILRVGNFGILIRIRPKVGDIFGIRLSDFVINPSVTWQIEIKPTKVELMLNGQSIYTLTDQQYFTYFSACQFRTGYSLVEPAFIDPLGREFPNRLRVDDFHHSSL